MLKLKNNAPYYIMEDKQLKLFDFDESLIEYVLNEPFYDFNKRIIGNNLVKTVKKWCFSF